MKYSGISRSVLFLFVTLFLCCSVTGQNADKQILTEQELIQKLSVFPTYREIVTYYLKNYKAPYESILHFEKKSDGWYVCSISINYSRVYDTINLEKIWNYSNKKFGLLNNYIRKEIPTRFDLNDSNSEDYSSNINEEINSFITYYDEKDYDLHPFYGYSGWITDVTKLLTSMELKTDQLNYSLARTYSRMAETVLRPQYGDEMQKYKPIDYEKVDNERLREYLYIANKSIDCYYKVYQINPRFVTIVGDIYTEYCNEYLEFYSKLLSIKEEKLARTYLKDSLYNQQSLAFARNYLISCPQNAILITNGDNDTYLLWYLQEKYGFRTDVRVANFQLMMTGWYDDMLRNKFLDSEPIVFSFDQRMINGNKREFVYCYDKADSIEMPVQVNSKEQYISLQNALKIAFCDDTLRCMINFNGIYYNTIPKKGFYITVNKDNVKRFKMLTENYLDKMADTIRIQNKKNFFYKNELVLLDLIATSDWQRPICFATTNGNETYMSFDSFLMQVGMVYLLVPVKVEAANAQYDPGWINSKVMYDNLLKNFIYPDFSDKNFVIDESILPQSLNYRSMFSSLAWQILKEGDSTKALEVLDYCEKVIPADKIKYDIRSITFSQIYYITGKTEKGDQIADQLIKGYSTEIQDYKSHKIPVLLTDKERMNSCLDYLIKLSQDNNRPVIQDKAEKLQKELKSILKVN